MSLKTWYVRISLDQDYTLHTSCKQYQNWQQHPSIHSLLLPPTRVWVQFCCLALPSVPSKVPTLTSINNTHKPRKTYVIPHTTPCAPEPSDLESMFPASSVSWQTTIDLSRTV